MEGIIAGEPSCRGLITFYGRIFAAQEKARPRIRLEPIHLAEGIIRTQRREQMPLVMTPGMVFDSQVSAGLLEEISRIAIDCGSELAEAAGIMSVSRIR
jgi:hypothetical protein